MKLKILIVLFVCLSFSLVFASTCSELDVCDQTCDEMGGIECGENEVCEGIDVEMRDGSNCCTFIPSCTTAADVEIYYDGVREEANPSFFNGIDFTWFVLISAGVVVFLFLIIILLVKPRNKVPPQ